MKYWLESTDKQRLVTLIIWLEEMSGYNADNPYGGLLEYVQGLNIAAAVSPLHDQDTYTAEDVRKWIRRNIDPDTGEVREDKLDFLPKVGDRKKAHAHIIIESKNPLIVQTNDETKLSWCAYFKDYGLDLQANRFQRVVNPDSAKRYLCHLDDEDKHLYNVLEVHTFGGIKMGALLRDDEFAKINAYNFCLQTAIEKKFRYYFQLVRWAHDTGNPDFIGSVKGNTSAFNNYFNSLRQAQADQAAARKKKEQQS